MPNIDFRCASAKYYSTPTEHYEFIIVPLSDTFLSSSLILDVDVADADTGENFSYSSTSSTAYYDSGSNAFLFSQEITATAGLTTPGQTIFHTLRLRTGLASFGTTFLQFNVPLMPVEDTISVARNGTDLEVTVISKVPYSSLIFSDVATDNLIISGYASYVVTKTDQTTNTFIIPQSSQYYTFSVGSIISMSLSMHETVTFRWQYISPVKTVTITDASIGGGGGVVPCFFGNAPVLTTTGYRRMDSIREGDKVMTPEGKEATVERMKVYQVAASKSTNPYVIPKGQFGATKKLLISPDHRVVTDSGLIEAKKLGLVQETREGRLTYYNLQLSGQANMVVAGVAVESLAPVERVVMPRSVFEALVAKKYAGRPAAEIREMVARTCRTLADGRVEAPVKR